MITIEITHIKGKDYFVNKYGAKVIEKGPYVKDMERVKLFSFPGCRIDVISIKPKYIYDILNNCEASWIKVIV